MKRRRHYLWTFLFCTLAGWAAAHFTVGNAGSVALRAAVSEGRMAFASREKESATARMASLAGKSLPDQAAIIAGWWQLTSVAEIRHLYAALDKLPREFRDAAGDILLGRWAMLDPDSLILAMLREGNFNKSFPYLVAFSRHWAAGRSPEEVAELVHSVAGDLRKFIPEPRTGGYNRPGESFAMGNRLVNHLSMDPLAALEVVKRLRFPMPAEGYSALFSALAKLNPAEAQRRLAEITDPASRRAAEAGIASQLAVTNPEAALALCAKGDAEMAKVIAPGYMKHLLSLPNAEAWQKAGEFLDLSGTSGHIMHEFLQRMALRDPAGLFQWVQDRPEGQRGSADFVIGQVAGPDSREAFRSYLQNAAPSSVRNTLTIAAVVNGSNPELQDTARWLAENAAPDVQISAAAGLVRNMRQDRFVADTSHTGDLIEMLHAAELSPDVRRQLINEDDVRSINEGIAASVSRNWPESAALLDGLSPAARETALPGYMRGAAAQEPERAAALLAAQPDSPAALEAAAALASEWARYDLDAAQSWAATLTGERRAKAQETLTKAAAGWAK